MLLKPFVPDKLAIAWVTNECIIFFLLIQYIYLHNEMNYLHYLL